MNTACICLLFLFVTINLSTDCGRKRFIELI